MKKNSRDEWLNLVQGILLIICAIFALSRPVDSLSGFIILYGIMALIIGIGDVVFYMRMGYYFGIGPFIALICGTLCIILGSVLLAHPSIGLAMFMILFPIWMIIHCISRLCHINYYRGCINQKYYIFSMIIYLLGLILGVILIVFPHLSVVIGGTLIGIGLLFMGIDHIAYIIFELHK